VPERKYDNTLFKLLNALGMSGWVQSHAEAALDSGSSAPAEDNRPIRHAQVRQYRNPKSSTFPESQYRPTSLTKFQDQDFRSVNQYIPEDIYLKGVLPNIEDLKKGPIRLNSKDVLGMGAGSEEFNSLWDGPLLQGILGLGNANMSLGYDPEQNKPYLSIFDSWDFNTGDGNGEQYMGFDALRNAGTPFNVYDRVYIEPFHDGSLPRYIQTEAKNQPVKGDIELPNSGERDPRLKWVSRRKPK
jgi:hypothetical protein